MNFAPPQLSPDSGDEPGAPGPDSRIRVATGPQWSNRLFPAALSLLALTAAISLAWSDYKLLDQDEMFVLQTDSVHTLRELLQIQLHYPISLDPLVYHALAHWSTCLFGANAFALRLPSLLGFLLMQACLYVFVRRCLEQSRVPHPSRFMGRVGLPIHPEAAALIALAFPAITATLFYSAEARPYGLLLGFSALTLAAWQSATNRYPETGATRNRYPETGAATNRYPEPSGSGLISEREEGALAPEAPTKRTTALFTLAFAIALALNTHYFAILLLIPLCLAEFVRTIQDRKLDIPVIAAIALGIAAEAFTLPFQHAAAEFRKHYYNADTIGPHAITQSYRALFVDYSRATLTTQRLSDIAFILLALGLIAAVAYRLRTHKLALTTAEAVFVIALAALPFFGFVLGYFVTHTLEVRYVLAAIIGISILVGLAVAPLLRTDGLSKLVFAVLVCSTALTGFIRIDAERPKFIAYKPTAAAINAWHELDTPSDDPIYIQELGHFEVLSYYLWDPAIRKRLTLVYSADDEILYRHHDTEALTAEHMRHFTALPIVRYEDLKQQPGEHLFILYQGGWNWTGPAFKADHATVTPLGPALEGEAASVRFR